MTHEFEVKDASGRLIHLSQERWQHITRRHPELALKLGDVEQCLQKPTLITRQRFNRTKHNYLLYDKGRKRYLLVAVRYINGKGHVITAFYTRTIIRR